MNDVDKRAAIERFYSKYASGEMQKVENAMKATVPVSDLFKMLRNRYKIPDDSTDPIAFGKPPSSPSSPSSPNNSGGGGAPAGDPARNERIKKFYSHYAPTDTGKLDNALKQTMPEEGLFKILRKKYNLPDDAPGAGPSNAPLPAGAGGGDSSSASATATATASSGGGGDDLRSKVVAFYNKHAPQDAHKIDKTLAHGLPEAELFARLRAKYNVAEDSSASASPPASPPSSPSGGGGGSSGDLKSKVTEWYQKYAPQDLARVDKTVATAEKQNISESDLLARLRSKYNIPEDSAASAGASNEKSPSATPSNASSSSGASAAGASGAGGGGNDLRSVVTRFYEIYASHDMARIDKTLATAEKQNIGEADLIARLAGKYGVTVDEKKLKPPAAAPDTSATASPTTTSSATAGGGGGENDLRTVITNFYKKFVPAEIERVDKTLATAAKQNLSEKDLMPRLCAKYQIDEKVYAAFVSSSSSSSSSAAATAEVSGSSSGGGGDLKSRVEAWYKKNAAHDLARVDKTVATAQKQNMSEADLFVRLAAKYNVPAETASPTTETKTAEAAPLQHQSPKTKVEAEPTPTPKPVAVEKQPAASPPESPVKAAAPEIPKTVASVVPTTTQVEEKKQQPATIVEEEQEGKPPVVAVSPSMKKEESTPTPSNTAPATPNIQQQQQQQQNKKQLEVLKIPQLSNPQAVSSYVQCQTEKIEELLFTLQQREEAVGMREGSVAARETAFESRCLSVGAEPTRIVFDAAGQQTAEFVSHMVDVESTLAACTADLVRLEKLLRQQERDLSDQSRAMEKREERMNALEEEKKRHLEERSHEVQKQVEYAMEMSASTEAERHRLAEMAKSLSEKENELAKREAMIIAQHDALRQREAAIELQHEASGKERDASRKFSEELLQREGTVRAVERSLNAARTELTRLENDVALHAKKLLEDQRALRRWSEELERREERFNRKNPNARG